MGDRTAHIDFYASLLRPAQVSLVDLGCGTGVVTAALAERIRALAEDRPIRICGIDGSARMLERARSRYQQIQWLQHDLRFMPPLDTFELAVCCFHTLQAFGDEALNLVLRSARQLLVPRGRFAFDIYRPNWPAIRHEPRSRIVRAFRDAQGRNLEIREESSFDTASAVYSLRWTLHHADEAPPATQAAFHFRFWQHEPARVESLLADARFRIIERYGDLDKSAFNESSKRQVLVCEAV